MNKIVWYWDEARGRGPTLKEVREEKERRFPAVDEENLQFEISGDARCEGKRWLELRHKKQIKEG